MATVKCIECGNEFEGKRSTARFCSAKCRVKFNTKTVAKVSEADEAVKEGLRKSGFPEKEIESIEMPTPVEFVEEPMPPPIETKKMVVDKEGELKTIPSKAALNRVSETAAALNKRFGEGTVMRFNEKTKQVYEVISTGSLGLDLAIGIGGLPLGRIVEIFGWESSGKSTIALNIIANAQKKNYGCLYIDAENAFDQEYAEALGVDTEAIDYSQPSCGEESLEVAEVFIRSGKTQVVIFDSVAAMIPKAEISGEHGESKLGLHARLMSQACRKLSGVISKQNVLVIFINQLRHKIGVMFTDPAVTTGGNALKFFASIRLDVSRSTSKDNTIVSEDGDKEGNLTTVKVVKNKCAIPFKKAQFNILYGIGIDKTEEVLVIAIKSGTITKNGTSYFYEGTKLAVGFEAAKQVLIDNPELTAELEQKIRKAEQ